MNGFIIGFYVLLTGKTPSHVGQGAMRARQHPNVMGKGRDHTEFMFQTHILISIMSV